MYCQGEGEVSFQNSKCFAHVSNVVDIEETISSTNWGLKGILDINAHLTFTNQRLDTKTSKLFTPLELKTGKRDQTHEAQVLLYWLLVNDKYTDSHRVEDDELAGLLIYLPNNTTDDSNK